MIKVLSIYGTRPEAIKMGPLCDALRKAPEIESHVCVTAQHRELLDEVNTLFEIVPDVDLDVMRDRQSLCGIASKVIAGLEGPLRELAPDLVLVHGDTTTTATAALAAFYCGIPVGHVEAGLRTYDMAAPFPEEANRVVVGHLAKYHFAPTKNNAANLAREGVTKGVYVTGNTVIDALKYTVRREMALPMTAGFENYIVLTAHRRENLGGPLEAICRAVRTIALSNPDVGVIYPVHPNPAVREPVYRLLSDIANVRLIEPVDAAVMHNLMSRCLFVMTDSGGLQEEAPALGKPVLVLRRETERPEAVEAGTVRLVGTKESDIAAAAQTLLTDRVAYDAMARAVNPYGDGEACRRIVEAILFEHGLRESPPDKFNA
ncbi:MAG TPA: UDP-N-acetylglucosamine 2-epimerase (non-hydrolyzing) [Terriglobales bacterium]|nr:UDP-N-acetylglucosamine 2-epimerase (non-hydrolyzing) [Terriglobales bacterium]